MRKVPVARMDELTDRVPVAALVSNVDLVVTRYDDQVSVLYGRCLHRGALLADGRVEGENLICGLHDWDYRLDSGVSAYNNSEALPRFTSFVEEGVVEVDADEVEAWALAHPQPYDREQYLGAYADVHGTSEEPHNRLIQALARGGIDGVGHHGPVSAMGVPAPELPRWDDLQFVTAQLHKVPLLDEDAVGSEVVIGPNAGRPLRLEIPLFVSDMSFGALSEEAKIALAR
ncbi:MAG: Rieske 2Fe-2S domain-containing protein, partial [Planctomycetota bacterium]|nr:Rieske 2Fe-2S domain-containing protein [Planctomycetota bacterium]